MYSVMDMTPFVAVKGYQCHITQETDITKKLMLGFQFFIANYNAVVTCKQLYS